MFGPGFNKEVYHVKVLYSDSYNNIKTRFDNLSSIREYATIREIGNPPDDCPYKYVYEDNIRGLEDFARFLRSFGSSVLALEPPELTKKMVYTYNRIIKKNEKMDGISYE